MITRSKVARRLAWTGMQVAETAAGWVLTPDERLRRELQAKVFREMAEGVGDDAVARLFMRDLDESSQILVTIEQTDRGGGRLLMTARIPCDPFFELGVEDLATDLDDGHYLAEIADRGIEIWALRDLGDRVPGRAQVRELALDLLVDQMVGGADVALELLQGRMRRRLESIAALRAPMSKCLVEQDEDGDLRWDAIGCAPVFLRPVPDADGDLTGTRFRLRIFSAFPMPEGGDSSTEVLAPLKAAHPDTVWDVLAGAQPELRQLQIGVVVPVPPELTAESLDAALALIEAAAADVEEHADLLGVVSSEALAGGLAPTPSDEDWREQVAADLAAIVEGGEHGSRLIRHDLLDRRPDGPSVVLRDTTDEDGSRLLVAALDESGNLVIRGEDRGPAVSEYFGEDVTCTEWVRLVEARHLPKLVRHLGGLPGESTLGTLARCGDGALEDALLVRSVVPYEDDHWES